MVDAYRDWGCLGIWPMRLMTTDRKTLSRPKPAALLLDIVRLDVGANAIEFALIIPFLLMLAGGIAEMTNMFFVRSQLNEVVRDATRRLAVDAFSPDEARQYIADQLTQTTDAQGNVTVVETKEKGEDSTDVTVSLDVPLKDLLIFDFIAETFNSPGNEPQSLSVAVTMIKN